MKKTIVLLMILFLLGSTALTAAGARETPSAGKTRITFWTLSGRQDAVEPIIKEFNAKNPDIEVVAAFYDTDGIKDACKVAASANTLPNMWFNWGGSLGGFYSDNGLTYDLTEYAEKYNWHDKFNDGAMALCTRNGELTGYPTSYNVLGVYYRKDIFDRLGLKVPTTFAEFEQVCATLKANNIIPISTAGKYGWHVMRFVELLVEHYAGAELHDKMNSFTESYNNEAVVKALAKYKEFVDKGYFPEGFVTIDPNDTQMAVFSGRAAMDIQGQWYDGIILQEEQDMNIYGTFAFPSGGTNRMSAFAEMTQFNANNTPAEMEAGIKFMDYYYSEEVANRFAAYYNMPLPLKGAKMPEGQPNVARMMEMSSKNSTFTITDQAFPTQVADVLFRAQDAIAYGQMTPQAGAAAIQRAIEDYLK
jgi:raffinose/stachyose/melibiose transport system substrate-binding protein